MSYILSKMDFYYVYTVNTPKMKAFSRTFELFFSHFIVFMQIISQLCRCVFEPRCKDNHKTYFLLVKNDQ